MFWAKPMTSKEVVKCGYRLIVSREPETEAAVVAKIVGVALAAIVSR
jgi:hypothetical protein